MPAGSPGRCSASAAASAWFEGIDVLRTDLIAPIPELLRRQAGAHGAKCAYRDAQTSVSTRNSTSARQACRAFGRQRHRGERHGCDFPAKLRAVGRKLFCCRARRRDERSDQLRFDRNRDHLPPGGRRLQSGFHYRGARGFVDTAARFGAKSHDADCDGSRRLRCTGVALRRVGDGAAAVGAARPASLHETAFILYTSGTTGRAKGVRLTVHGMLWVTAACWAPIAGLCAHDILLSPLPLFHSYALNLSVLSILATGATGYIMERFSTAKRCGSSKAGNSLSFPACRPCFIICCRPRAAKRT